MYREVATQALLLLSFFPLGIGQTAQPEKRLWVLREPGEVVEYDPATWNIRNTIKVPAEAIKDPGSLAINSKGQMLFCPAVETGMPGQFPDAGSIWLWNGKTSATLDGGAVRRADPATGNKILEVESIPRCYLSSDGQQLYWFANLFRVLKQGEGGEESVSTVFRAWQTDTTGANPKPCATFSFPPCQCETGVCQETCPEAVFWNPIGGVDDFFMMTHLIPGQIGTTYQASFWYRKSDGKWTSSRLPQAIEEVLDAVKGGAVLVHRRLDGGCCGWDNVSNDQTLLRVNDKDVVIFDEIRSFANPDYDVSFYTSNARLSPEARSVAMTITATASAGADIRLSESGKPNPDELARIRRAIADLPAVEVVAGDNPSKPLFRLKHSISVGWLSDNEILVIEDGSLVAVVVPGGARREAKIRVANESFVFVR